MSNPDDVIISWMGSVPDATLALFKNKPRVIPMPMPHDASEPNAQHYKEQFQWAPSADHPWVIGGWPHPLRAILQHYGVDKPLRVAMFGFSQGCQGPLICLKSQDAGYIEHVMLFDGLHCSWYPGKEPNEGRSNIEPTCLGATVAQAALAVKGPTSIGGMPPAQHYMTITHSSIIPPTYPATFDTAREIMARIWEEPPDAVLPDGTIGQTFNPPWVSHGIVYDHDTCRYAVGENGLTIMGYDNIDPMGTADHIYQGNVVLKTVIEKLLMPRWNSVDSTAATCTSGATSGPSCNPVAPAKLPDDYFINPQDASTDWEKWAKLVSQSETEVNVAGIVASAIIGGTIGLGLMELWKLIKAHALKRAGR